MAVLAHTLVFSNEITIDMRYLCPKDVRKMLLQRARSENWKKWAAKHEYEELKDGAWRASSLAKEREGALDRKASQCGQEDLFGRRGWTQQRLFDIGWSDVSQCQACKKEQGTEKHRLYHCPQWYEVRREIPEVHKKVGAKNQNLKEGVEVAKRYRGAPSQ